MLVLPALNGLALQVWPEVPAHAHWGHQGYRSPSAATVGEHRDARKAIPRPRAGKGPPSLYTTDECRWRL